MIIPDGVLNFKKPVRGYPIGLILGPDYNGNLHVVVERVNECTVGLYCLDTEEAVRAVTDAGIELLER